MGEIHVLIVCSLNSVVQLQKQINAFLWSIQKCLNLSKNIRQKLKEQLFYIDQWSMPSVIRLQSQYSYELIYKLLYVDSLIKPV